MKRRRRRPLKSFNWISLHIDRHCEEHISHTPLAGCQEALPSAERTKHDGRKQKSFGKKIHPWHCNPKQTWSLIFFFPFHFLHIVYSYRFVVLVWTNFESLFSTSLYVRLFFFFNFFGSSVVGEVNEANERMEKHTQTHCTLRAQNTWSLCCAVLCGARTVFARLLRDCAVGQREKNGSSFHKQSTSEWCDVSHFVRLVSAAVFCRLRRKIEKKANLMFKWSTSFYFCLYTFYCCVRW